MDRPTFEELLLPPDESWEEYVKKQLQSLGVSYDSFRKSIAVKPEELSK